jgi:hypothetical protein
MTSLHQRIVDPTSQQFKCVSVGVLHQSHQFLPIEIKGDTPPADVLQLDQLFVQAVSEGLQTKLLAHSQVQPTTANDANVQRFSDLIQHAIEAKKELMTITNIASGAAHRQSKPHAADKTRNRQDLELSLEEWDSQTSIQWIKKCSILTPRAPCPIVIRSSIPQDLSQCPHAF